MLRLAGRHWETAIGMCKHGLKTREADNLYDMIIVGGGMVGFGLAAISASSQLLSRRRILLVENSPRPAYRVGETYEVRTVALNQASQTMLEGLGAWSFITSKRLSPVKEMKVWETQSDACLTFSRDRLAHIVENSLVTESLLNVLETRCSGANLTVCHDTAVREICLPDGSDPQELVQLTLRSGGAGEREVRSVKTSLLVGADGFQSAVRKTAGIPTVSWSHGQSAVVAIARMDKKQDHEASTAFQRFLPTGPLALLPLPNNHCSVIWSTTNSEADRLMTLTEDAFVEELNEALTRTGESTPRPGQLLGQLGRLVAGGVDYLLGSEGKRDVDLTAATVPRVDGLQNSGERKRYPLGFQHANSYHSSRRVVLVGDAAHRILPLAGQGVNLGFGDVTSLVRFLEEAASRGADLGSMAFLKNYTTERQRAVVPVAATMELLNLLYSTDAFCGASGTDRTDSFSSTAWQSLPFSPAKVGLRLLAGLRAAGVETVQSSNFLKNFLVEAAVSGNIGVPTGSI